MFDFLNGVDEVEESASEWFRELFGEGIFFEVVEVALSSIRSTWREEVHPPQEDGFVGDEMFDSLEDGGFLFGGGFLVAIGEDGCIEGTGTIELHWPVGGGGEGLDVGGEGSQSDGEGREFE